MHIVVLTGLSGSGKSTVLRALEDLGFFAIDNLPIPLLERLFELFSGSQGESEKLALVVDARTAIGHGAVVHHSHELDSVPKTLHDIKNCGHRVDLVFLDSSDEVLVRRFSETRRRHPLSVDGSVREGIAVERKLLASLRSQSSMTVHTDGMSVHDLRRHIQDVFLQRTSQTSAKLNIAIMSFGFKHGLPQEADLVFDVRFIPNPYFVEHLRRKTGQDSGVADYVLQQTEAKGFLVHLQGLLSFLLPQYENEGKAYLTIALGCTGGRHRSVVLAAQIAEWIEQDGHRVRVLNRDIER